MEVEKVLERVGFKREEIVIDKPFFHCGRMKESDLVCLSLLVSREHCLFTRLGNDLYVTDLASSNGIFINGKQQRQKKEILLREGDLIGIGCGELTNLDPTMFVYKIKNRVVLRNDCDSSTSDAVIDRHVRKEQSRNRLNGSNNNDEPLTKKAKNDDDDEIEIIEVSSACSNDTGKSRQIEINIESSRQLSQCASTSGEIRQELNGMMKKSGFVRQSTGTIEPHASASVERHTLPKQLEIVDITEPSTSRKGQDDDDNDIMEIDLSPPSINNKVPVHTNLSKEVQNNFDEFKAPTKIKQEKQNIPESNNQVTVKEEADWQSFSQNDVVEINDDDDIFPSSQLFDRTVVKDEINDEDEDYNTVFSSLFCEEDDDNVITILDDDDDEGGNLIISGDNLSHPIQKIKIEPGLEPTIEFVNVGEIASSSASNETDNVYQNNIDIPNDEQTDALIASLTTDQSLEEQLSAMHQDSHDQPDNTLVNRDLLINKGTSIISNQSNICGTKDPPISSPKNRSVSNAKDKSISSPKDKCISSPKDKSTLRRGLEICEPHFIKPKKKGKSTDKRNDKKSKHKSEKKSSKKSRSSDSPKTSSKDGGERSSKDKDHKKDKLASKDSSKKSSREKESNKNDKSLKDKHQNISSEEHFINQTNQETNGLQNTNDENKNKNLSNSDVSNESRPKNKTTKVKAKVSLRTRSLMLCEAMQASQPPKRKDVKSKGSELPKEKTVSKPDSITSFVIPRRPTSSCSVSSTSSMSMVSPLSTSPSTSTSRTAISSTVIEQQLDDINSPPSPFSSPGDTRSPSPVVEPIKTNHSNESAVTSSNSNLKSALKSVILKDTNKKSVLFRENIAAIREFPIEEGNLLRNIKDGHNLRSCGKDFVGYRTTELRIEDFLVRVFSWEPIWIQEQQKFKTLPPIVKKEDMQHLPDTFKSFDQYYRRMEVLLLLETWQYLVKEYECTGNRYSTSSVLPCSIMRNSIRQMVTPNKLRYSMMHINTLVTKHQLRLQEHPIFGDLIILEYTIKYGNSLLVRRSFAYVVQVQQQNALKYLRSNHMLNKHVQNPDALLTYVVHTKMVDEQTVHYDQVARLRSMYYIRPHLRLIQGLQYVPQSDLCDSILNVDIEQFQLESVTNEQIEKYDLVTKEKLNAKQMEAVIKFTNASVRMEPKIGLLVGPPGTGKSKVIANLVTQILYGDGRYVNGQPLRILVCAPSNAAIDEIVLRLLEIRGAIAEHRFKMVRIGRLESMHEEVKKISITELAKRDAQKTLADHMHKTSEGVEHKKHKLKADIDALESLLASNPKHIGYRMDLENLRNKYKKLTNRRPEDDAAELGKLESAAKTVILQKANVIACTLSSCYTGQMESIFGGNSNHKIATCIVDEATQCCEAETLIPLMLGVKSLILVGDPNQLPATIMSTEAKKLGLDKSLFTRTKRALEPQVDFEKKTRINPIITLCMQYRMVQAISHWPNRYFYGGYLKDMADYRNTFPFQSYRILNLDGVQDNIKFQNTSEAAFVGNLIHTMMTCPKINLWNRKISVGIITPYQNQKSVILSTIKEQIRNVSETLKNKFSFEVNTIDSFQGQERDVIIMSLVRSSGIGFLSDPQRLCVALTRAKFTLIICGNFMTFQRDIMWKDLLRDARSRGIVARLPANAKPYDIKPHVVRLD